MDAKTNWNVPAWRPSRRGNMARHSKTNRMDQAMRDRRTLYLAFVLGLFVFVFPMYEIIVPRSPVVETTNFRIVPSTVKVGQMVEAVWTDKTLRTGCEGIVYRRFTAGAGESWIFGPTPTAHHGVVGEVETFHSSQRIPNMPAGTGKFRKGIKRWCNIFQEYIWPMSEVQEAEFMVVE
jgi:hypothetical protein